jgi:hypothetical protein
VLRQDVDIAGGVAGSASAEKPGTVYIATGVDQADVALETRAWSDAGAFGLVFRWQGRGDYYRFSVGLDRFRLARVRGGIVRQLWSSREGFAPGVPSRLVVQVEGTRIRCQVDDRLVCDLRDDAADAPGSGSVGLYTWRTDSAAFDEVRARPWPGGALAPARVHVAELEATRPLFTDAFDNLDAFDQQTLGTREAVTGSTAAAGVATIARRRASDAIVVALAGDSDAGDYSVECNAQPGAEGAFGLVVRHDGGGRHVALVLTPGVGRALVAQWAAGSGLGASAVLWDDPRPVAVGQVYALSVECSGETVTIGIDGERFTASLP